MTDSEKRLTELVIRDLIKSMSEEPKALEVKSAAFEVVINERIMQVQISICSDVEDFLEDFQTVIINPYQHKV